jgi:hypothetical protein
MRSQSSQHRHRDREYVTRFGTVQDRLPHVNAVDAVEHVHDCVAGAGLEQPILRRVFDRESSPGGGGLGIDDIGLGYHQVHVVAGFGCPVRR